MPVKVGKLFLTGNYRRKQKTGPVSRAPHFKLSKTNAIVQPLHCLQDTCHP